MKKTVFLLLLLTGLLVPWATQAQNYALYEGFEGGSLPTGWTQEGPGTWSVGTGDYNNSTGAGSGSYNARITHGNTGNVTKLITPPMDLSTGNYTYTILSFMHIQREWSGDQDELRVYYRSSENDSWHELRGYTDNISVWMTEDGILLPNLSSTYQIAFEMTDGYGYGVGIDDVIIEQQGSCLRPTGLNVNYAIGSTSARVTWNGTADYYHIYINEGTTEWEYTTTNTFYNLTNLIWDHEYAISVASVCGTDESVYSAISFTPTAIIEIGSGSATSHYLPTSTNSNYSLSEQIYNSDELGDEGVITTIEFYKTGTSTCTRNLEIYMVGTSSPFYYSSWIPVTSDNLVFQGAVEFGGNEWTSITLGTPFYYDGESNVAIVIYDYTGTTTSTQEDFLSFELSSYYQSVYFAGDNSFTPTVSTNDINSFLSDIRVWEVVYSKNQIRIHKTPPACQTPEEFSISNVTNTSATLSWTQWGEPDNWEICLNDDEDNLITANTNPFTLTNLTPDESYTVKVRANCGTDGQSRWSEQVGFVATDMIIIGTRERSSSFLPACFGYSLSRTEQIYTADELGTSGTILNLSFYCNNDYVYGDVLRTFKVYMKSTDLDEFQSTSNWISVNEDDLVFDGDVTFPIGGSWINIELDTPFNYDGEDNVVIMIESSGYDVDDLDCSIYTNNTNQSIYIPASNTFFFDDPSSFGNLSTDKNQIRILKIECPSPYRLTATDVTNASVTLSWTERGTAVSWDVEYSTSLDFPENDQDHPTYTRNNLSTTSISLTSLASNTTYYVRVKSGCGDEASWSTTYSFTTDCEPQDKCEISYELFAESGIDLPEGWNGAAIRVVDVTNPNNQIELARWTIGSDTPDDEDDMPDEPYDFNYASGSLQVCNGKHIRFEWESSIDSYNDELYSFVVYDWSGAAILSGNGGEYVSDEEESPENDRQEIGYYFVDCSAIGVAANSWYAISAYTQDGYDLVSDEILTSDDYDLYRYDESSATWQNYRLHEFPTLETGRGYIYRRADEYTPIDFGTANTTDLNSVQTLTTACTSDVNLKGFNLIGNPYQKAIYKGENFPNTNLSVGFYSLKCDGSWLVHTDNDPIGVGEGVLVKVDGENPVSLSFTYNAVNAGGKSGLANHLQFTVSCNDKSDVAYAILASQFTILNSEGLPKIAHLNAEAPSLSIPQGGTDYAIAMIDGSTQAFPLKFRAVGNGEYTVSVSGDMSEMGYLHLIDRATGSDIDLLSQPTYTFSNTRSQASTQRFTVKLSPNADEEGNSIFAYQNGDRIVVEGTGTLQVYDVLGRQLFTHEINSQLSISNSQFPSTGVYILRLGEKSQKLVIK